MRPRVSFTWGVAVLFDYASYDGKRDVDAVGDSLEPDEMTIFRLLVGMHARAAFGRFFYVAGQFGVGPAFISKVDATLDLPSVPQPPIEFELYEQTTTFGFELSVRTGVKFDVGPGLALGVFLFGGLGVTGAPEDGDLDADAESMLSAFGGLGLSLDFGAHPADPAGPLREGPW